jgi:hypothetical protein
LGKVRIFFQGLQEAIAKGIVHEMLHFVSVQIDKDNNSSLFERSL